MYLLTAEIHPAVFEESNLCMNPEICQHLSISPVTNRSSAARNFNPIKGSKTDFYLLSVSGFGENERERVKGNEKKWKVEERLTPGYSGNAKNIQCDVTAAAKTPKSKQQCGAGADLERKLPVRDVVLMFKSQLVIKVMES
ncbi:uncharacterized protein ACNLHF_018105 isoform 1-T1 [Anomaloglossus baeobatrachus]